MCAVSGVEKEIPVHVQEARLNQDLTSYWPGWKHCNNRFHDHTIHCDPDWIAVKFKGQKEDVHIYFLQRGEEILGAVPFVLSNAPLFCKLGPSTVAKLPFRSLNLIGYTPNLPEESSIYDMLIDQVLQSDFDAIQLNNVKAESLFWNYLHSSPLIQKFFSLYTKLGPLPHPLIRVNGSFECYMKNRFSGKMRKNRFREIKKLRDLGEMQCIRVTKESELDAFLEAARGLDKKTRKFVRYGWGIASRNLDELKNEMQFLARRGWLRSYLLTIGGVPCSFIFGQQYCRKFYTAEAGVDPALKKYSAGTVLFMLVLEDLFRENSPQFYDLDSYRKYKEHFANESYLEASVWLFRRRTYPLLARSIYHAFNATSARVGALLDRADLKSSLTKLIEAKVSLPLPPRARKSKSRY